MGLKDDDKLLDEVTNHMVSNRLPHSMADPFKNHLLSHVNDLPPICDRAKSPRKSNDAPTDQELMAIMMSRVQMLEKKAQEQAIELKSKDKSIQILADKLDISETARHNEDKSPDYIHDLETKCMIQQQKITEMESFLADYGLTWVGEEPDIESSTYLSDKDTTAYPGYWKAEHSVPKEFVINHNVLVKNIEQMNLLAGEGTHKVHITKDGARLKAQDSIPLAIYANGIVLYDGPFRPITDFSTQTFVQDLPSELQARYPEGAQDSIPLTIYANGIVIYDGPFRPITDFSTQRFVQDLHDRYFPSELQARYPEGVPFNLTDKRGTTFVDQRAAIFEGPGEAVGGDMRKASMLFDELSHHTSHATIETKLSRPTLSTQSFLKRLPANVIKDGRIVPVRDEVAEQLTGYRPASSTTPHATLTTPVPQSPHEVPRHPSPTPNAIIRLRVRTPTGKSHVDIKVRNDMTVGELKTLLDKKRTGHSSAYQLVLSYPHKVLRNESMTLKQYEIAENTVLFMTAITQPKSSHPQPPPGQEPFKN